MTTPYAKVQARKPVGGFIFLTVQQLYLLWWTYRTRLIRLVDVRVWCAAQEMVARRCELDVDQVPDYTLQELHRLVGGVGGEHLRASVRRLEALGLLTWSAHLFTFATGPTDLRSVHNCPDFAVMLQTIPNHHRRVPVPRQTIRLIAGGCRASIIATMLGYLFRCLYYHEHRCVSGGWCKISWIAKVFCMDQRNIKAARKHLVTIGWLCLCDTPQAVCNRWGIYGQVNLSWTRAVLEPATQDTAATPCTGSPPPAEFSTTKLPPLYKEHTEPLQEYKHQNPVPPADTAHAAYPVASAALPPGTKTGVQIQPANGTKTSFLPPTLQHIVPDDLRDTARLLTLFAQAQQHGLIDGSDSARLTFVAMAEHAHGLGTANPCGLFAALVRRQCWHYITDRDEDAASARLKQYWYGRAGPRPSAAPPRVAAPPLSKDAFMVRELQRELTRAGFQGEAFAWVHRAYPEWTRVRWDLAVAELTTAQQGWQRINAGTSLDACAQVLDSSWAA